MPRRRSWAQRQLRSRSLRTLLLMAILIQMQHQHPWQKQPETAQQRRSQLLLKQPPRVRQHRTGASTLRGHMPHMLRDFATVIHSEARCVHTTT